MGYKQKAIVIRENLTLLIDWSSSIYGIFWGVWLATYTQSLVDQCKLRFLPYCLKPWLIIGFILLLSLYIFHFVKWLWRMRFSKENPFFARTLSLGEYPTWIFLSTMIVIGFIGFLFYIPLVNISLVFLSTLVWVLMVILIVNWDWRGWLAR